MPTALVPSRDPMPTPHDPLWISRASRVMSLQAAWHRLELRGMARVPAGPALLVGNHNGGANPVDGLFLIEWYRQRGMTDPVYVLAHEFFFKHLRLEALLAPFGVIRADPAEAARALRAGAKVLVFPGGDADSLRPYSARKELRFEGRQGYARLAMETGAPIVPVVTAGAHGSMVVLRQGQDFARRTGLARWLRFRSFPVTLAVPWGLCVGPAAFLPYVPLPVKVTVEFGAPIDPTGHADAASLARAVEAVMGARLRALSDERR
ncbi:MAG: putative acyltransferase [Myxococcaceae bacterium]|nr:putative acyltransferase [Myxococcaceae bacterium]